MSNKKVKIQEISSYEFQNNQDKEQMEVEQSQSDIQKSIVSEPIQYEQGKAVKKDLLRLEKNYFDNIYDEKKHKNEKSFAISKMLNQNQQNIQKPDFKSFAKSSIKDRLNQFMPGFKRDTDDLLVNIERQEQLRIDDRNQYEIEDNNESESDSDDSNEEFEEEQSNNSSKKSAHQQEIVELKRRNKENEKKKQKTQQDPSKPKMIQLDMLLGVLEEKNPEQANTQIDMEDDEQKGEQDSNSLMTQNTKQIKNLKIQEIDQ